MSAPRRFTACLLATLGLSGAFAPAARPGATAPPAQRGGWLAVGDELGADLGWPAWRTGVLPAATALVACLLLGRARARSAAPRGSRRPRLRPPPGQLGVTLLSGGSGRPDGSAGSVRACSSV